MKRKLERSPPFWTRRVFIEFNKTAGLYSLVLTTFVPKAFF
jgi:hypothetical protein